MINKATIALTVAVAIGISALTSVAWAQEVPQKRENVRYYRVVHLNFKPGHNQAAWAILYGKIATAVRSTGRNFVALDWESGPWDSSIYIALEEGYGTLEYAQSPQGAAFRAALDEQEGGKEAGQKVWDEWMSHIDSSSQAVAHMHLPPEEGSSAD
ncbi:MAG: hypothetical protein R3192_04810 [Woeseiaceae bacterium]|nr:hypothetical protein [Woeseiaceae bacterium]